MLEEDRTAICGQRYQHQVERQASRAGTVPSEVVLGGRKVALRRPRVSEPKECGELLHASPELQDFLLEFRCPQVRHVQADHDLRCLAEPATGRRARNSEIGGDGHVPGAVDEIPKPVVVALLRTPRSRHEDDHRRFGSRRSTAQPLEDIAGGPPT